MKNPNVKHPIETLEVNVLGVRCRKSNTGKPSVVMKVQSASGAKISYVRCTSVTPPMPGTRIKVTGSVESTPNGRVIRVRSDDDIKCLTGQQGLIFRDAVVQILNRVGVNYDLSAVNYHLLQSDVHLPNIDKEMLVSLLKSAGITHAYALVDSRESVFSSVLTRTLLSGCENIALPYEVDHKREIPFRSDVWPSDVLDGCMPNYIEATHGLTVHKGMPLRKKLYLSDILKYDGVDNFFRALAVHSERPGIYGSWIQDAKRPAMLTNCFIKDKQKEGIQIFTPDILKQLERMGIIGADQIAARLGNMYHVALPNEPSAYIPQGTYQSASRIATLDKLARRGSTLNVAVDATGLDAEQEQALRFHCAGTPLLLVAGPAGTGKSTLITRIIQHTFDAGGDEEVVVLTPTGKSSSHLNQGFEDSFPKSSRPMSSTIHSIFYPGRSVNHPGFSTFALKSALDSTAVHAFPVRIDRILHTTTYREGDKEITKPAESIHMEMLLPASLSGKTVIIDESAQVTTDLMALVFSLRPKRIIMAGDPSQVRPVGAGQPFRDLINCARDGLLDGKATLVELRTDHRALPELSSFTKRLRAGEIPLESVMVFDEDIDDSSAIAESVLLQGGTAVEVNSMLGVTGLIDQLYSHIMAQEPSVYTFHHSTERDIVITNDSYNLILPCQTSNALSCKRTVLPDVMVMAYTNAEVAKLNQHLRIALRPHVTRGQAIQGAPVFAGLISNDLFPGDVLMQTENSKTRLRYETPQGSFSAASTMNGESYVFLGANVWLPMPSTSNQSDINFKVNNAWSGSGLRSEAEAGNAADTDFHSHLYQRLTSLAEQGNTHAAKLVHMALGEVLIIDQPRLLQLGRVLGKLGKHCDVPEAFIRRLPILPALPKTAPGAIHNDDGSMALVRQVWRITESSRAPIEYPAYQRLYDHSEKTISTFVSGNAYTVNRAQGSQARTAISVVSPPIREDDASGHESTVYTSATRAQKRSVLLVHGKSVAEINQIWSDSRERNGSYESAITAIVKGEIAPLCDTLSMSTTYTPHKSIFAIVPGDPSRSTLPEYRQRVALASMGLPADINLCLMPVRLATLVASSEPNSGKTRGTFVIPDSSGVAARGISDDALNIKRKMAWLPSGSLIANGLGVVTDADLDAALSDFDFSGD
jgi:hypothetical protein